MNTLNEKLLLYDSYLFYNNHSTHCFIPLFQLPRISHSPHFTLKQTIQYTNSLFPLPSIRFGNQLLKETFLPWHPRFLLFLLFLRHNESLAQLRIRARRHLLIPRIHDTKPRIRLRHHHVLRHKSPFPAKRILAPNPFLPALF